MNRNDIIQSAIRISRMESLFDELAEAARGNLTQRQTLEVKEAIRTLSEYVSSGDWLHDYDLDQQRLLPPGLKRGVLSQDGLYNLLCEMAE